LKLQQENIGKHKDTGTGNNFLSKTLVAQEMRARIGKWECIKLTGFCIANEIVNRMKGQPTVWERNLCKLFIKGLISRIYKEVKN
jgi:hypothetical protein